MMVHLQNAGAAHAAVVAAVWLMLLAPLAVPPLPRLLGLVQARRGSRAPTAGHEGLAAMLEGHRPEAPLVVVGDGARASDEAADVANDHHYCHQVKDRKLQVATKLPASVPGSFGLHHPPAMDEDVDGVKASHENNNENDGGMPKRACQFRLRPVQSQHHEWVAS